MTTCSTTMFNDKHTVGIKRNVQISLILMFTLMTCVVSAEIMPEGQYQETECKQCILTINHVTPHQIIIDGYGMWVGLVAYHESKEAYSGTMEWKKGKGAAWEGQLLNLSVYYDQKTDKIKFIFQSDKMGTNVREAYRIK